MISKNFANNYQKVQANTASPGQRVVMVYKGICKNLLLASDQLRNSTHPERFMKATSAIQLALQLILELQLALDKENGGEIAANLNKLYSFWRKHLEEANLENNPDKIDAVHAMVKDLTDSWIEAEKSVRGQQ